MSDLVSLLSMTQQLAIHPSQRFDAELVPAGDDVEVVRVVVGELDEFPIYVSATPTQLLFITYLWREEEVNPEHRVDMLEAMLDMNIPIPLSSFSSFPQSSITQAHYVRLWSIALRNSTMKPPLTSDISS
ncbi:MAG: DUF2170 family protein [Pseudomonadota bacterium]